MAVFRTQLLSSFVVHIQKGSGFNAPGVCFPAKDKGEKKLFGFSFVPLMQEDGRTLPDGTHELIVHKVRLSKYLVRAVCYVPKIIHIMSSCE